MKRTLLIVGLVLGLALVFAACAPAVAPTEAPVVEAPAEPTAVPPTEVPPAPTEDPAVAIAEEFASTGHADAASESFVHWDEEAEIPTSCAKCHSEAGFTEFASTGAIAAGIPVPGKPFTCTLCHSDAADALTAVTFPSGVVVENLGKEAICMTCHQGRESTDSVDAKLAKYGEDLDPDAVPAPLPAATADGKPIALSFSNVHYAAAASTLYGGQVRTGYQYPGKMYDVKLAHVTGYDTCVSCHDPHKGEVKLEACTECHGELATAADLKNVREPSSAFDYDGDGELEGIGVEIEGMQAILLTSIQNYALEVAGAEIKYDAATYPYFMGADGKSYANWTPRLLKAAFNYQVALKDAGGYAHGGKYLIQLMFDSIEDLNASEKLTTKFDVETLAREDSGHFNGATESWRHWDEATETKAAYTVEAGCATCHSANGIIQAAKGEEVTENPAGNGLTCYSCHDFSSYPPTILPQADVTIASGKTISFGENAASNICLNCHSARTGKITIDKMITDFAVTDMDAVVAPATIDGKEVKFSFKNSHYQGVAGQWFGTDAQVAYEYEGKTYVGTNKHPVINEKAGCVGCHDGHTGEIDLANCTTCHAGVEDVDLIRMYPTDWDGDGNTTEGLRDEYTPIRDAMYASIVAYAKDTVGVGILYNRDVYPYWFEDKDGNEEIDTDADGKNVAYTSWTARLMKAAYNFNWLRKTSGGFAHNFKYITQIAIDTIEDLGGDVTTFVRP